MSKPRATPASPIFTSGALDRARTGEVDNETVRSRLAPVHELAHLTVENQVAISCTIRHGDRNPAARPFALNCMPSRERLLSLPRPLPTAGDGVLLGGVGSVRPLCLRSPAEK